LSIILYTVSYIFVQFVHCFNVMTIKMNVSYFFLFYFLNGVIGLAIEYLMKTHFRVGNHQ